jgi:hypothetical protein
MLSRADEAIGHRKRFESLELKGALEAVGFVDIKVQEFNRLAAVGWMVNKVLGLQGYRSLMVRIFGLVLPLARLIERVRSLPGLSFIAVGHKPH